MPGVTTWGSSSKTISTTTSRTLPLGYIPYGGADFGEVAAVGRAVGDGDDTAFYERVGRGADKLAGEARTLADRGRRTSARELFLKASCFYGISYRPLYGRPVDPRLVAAFRKQTDAFNRGVALRDPPAAPLRIPFEGTSLPAYLIPAVGHETAVRPLLICTNGYDAAITDMFFASAVAATARGYHCLIFDGPGQGEMLFEHGMPLRPDWETVVKAVGRFRGHAAARRSRPHRAHRLEPRRTSRPPRGVRRASARRLHRRSRTVEHDLGSARVLREAWTARRGRGKSRGDGEPCSTRCGRPSPPTASCDGPSSGAAFG